MSEPQFRGTWYVLPTPFADDLSLDLNSIGRLIEACINWDVEGLTVMGVTSEVAALSDEERSKALATIFSAAAGAVPVAVGCSAATSGRVLRLAGEALELGAAALMVAAPSLLRNLDLLPPFFDRVSKGCEAPLIVQDEPAATGVNIPASVLYQCLRSANSRTLKLEDPPTPPKIGRLLQMDGGLQVFGGLGGVSALSEFRRGSCGTMTGFSYPEVLRATYRAYRADDFAQAAEVFDSYLPLVQFEAQPVVGVGIRKEVLRRRQVIAASATRQFPSVDAATAEELTWVLQRVGLQPSPEPLYLT